MEVVAHPPPAAWVSVHLGLAPIEVILDRRKTSKFRPNLPPAQNSQIRNRANPRHDWRFLMMNFVGGFDRRELIRRS
jgi:hypothetical protein